MASIVKAGNWQSQRVPMFHVAFSSVSVMIAWAISIHSPCGSFRRMGILVLGVHGTGEMPFLDIKM